ALAARRSATLTIVGPCGNDPDYGDAVLDAIAEAESGRIVWQPSMASIAPLYRQAQVVLVGSRNEALGMVGLEALAHGLLLVAHRSTGYEAIIDPSRHEGLLFDDEEDADAVASRVLAALDQFPRYAHAARRKAAASFDAAHTARRLTGLWQELRGAGD
ncbi:MAG TPA: glycosyltransferase family 4 protein, partial [Luteitalea sp.]|nr:glycosyltransferase family 4 protein [Luteitalea sp.]